MDKGERMFYVCLTIMLLALSYFAVACISYFVCWAFELDIWSWKLVLIVWAICFISNWLLRLGDHNSDE